MDSNLGFIRQQLKDYENNMDNEKGCHYLEKALECAMEVLKPSNNKDEYHHKVYNYIYKHMEKTIEKAKGLLNNPSASSIQLEAIHSSMQCFIDSGFDGIPDCFMPLKSKILIQWVDASMNEGKPSGIELCKKEICETLIKSSVSPDVAFKVTGYIPTVRTHNGVRPLTDNEKEEWCFYMKNKS